MSNTINPSDYAAATEIVIWKTGWYNGLPAVIRAVGVTETQIVLDNGTIAETNVRGIKGLGALRKLPGWSEVAPVVVEPVAEPVVIQPEPEAPAALDVVQSEPPAALPPVPDVSLLTTLADVARAIADEVAGLARSEVVSALKVRAGEIALGGFRVRVPKAEVVREVAAPATASERGSIASRLDAALALPGARSTETGVFLSSDVLRAAGFSESGATNAGRWDKTSGARAAAQARGFTVRFSTRDGGVYLDRVVQ